MAAETAAEIAIAGGEKIAGSITEVIIQQFKDIYHLEDNHGDLNEKIKLMETKVSHVRTLFQNQRKVLEGHAQNCITKMEGEVEKAKKLSVRVEQRRSRCFDCWNLCYPKLATECRECKTNLVSLIEEINGEFKFLADVEQIVQAAPSEAKPVVLQHVPAGGFVGSFMESAQVELQTWLAESRHRVVGVWGMGGIGKTSLLKMIHNHFKEARDIFEDVIWVVVSQNFQVEGLQKTIGKKVHLKFDESCDNDERRTELSAYLEKKKFLIILDDMWEKIDLDKVGISFGKDKGSKVLISTRSEHVIAQMGAQECSLKMKALSEEEAWDLFKEKAFTNCQAALDKNIEAIAKKIALECKGLPLAVNVVGAAMVSRKTKDDWDRALHIMRSTDSSFKDIFCDIDKELYRPLRYSYDDLSDELKICFLYCAAFQEDAKIDAQRLVEILIAEGVLFGRETTYLMDLGYEYFHQLGNRCLIDWRVVRHSQRGTVAIGKSGMMAIRIKVHDVLRDMAIRIGKSEEHCLFATNQHLTNFPREKEVSNCKRISLAHNDIRDLLPQDLMKCPNLVSLLLASNQRLTHVPEPFLSSVMSLRVLDLSSTGIKELPISVGGLRLLEFLDLSDCPNLIELPESIGNLSALQFFNLDGCSKLKGLPSTIRGLKNLKHLTLDDCYQAKVNSDDIGQFTSLNRLVLPWAGDATLRAGDVNNFTKMRALDAAVVTAEDGGVGIIDTLTEIKQLTLSFQLDASEQGVTIKNIESVEFLCLINYKRASLPVCEFQNLKVLQLFDCSEVRELPIQSFPMLEVLLLCQLETLDSLSGISEGSMPNIQQLRIDRCPMLMKLPSPMTLPSLQELCIYTCKSIKELDIGNCPSLKYWSLCDLRGLERITSSNGVWNEEAISQLEAVKIMYCPSLKRISKRLIKLFKSNKMEWDDRARVGWKDEDNIDNDEDESIALEYLPDEYEDEDEEWA